MSELSAEQADRRDVQGAPSAGAAQGHVEQELGQTPPSLDAKRSVASPWQLCGSEGPKQSPPAEGTQAAECGWGWQLSTLCRRQASPPAALMRGDGLCQQGRGLAGGWQGGGTCGTGG